MEPMATAANWAADRGTRRRLTDAQVKTTVLEGLPQKHACQRGSDADMPPLLAYIRAMRPAASAFSRTP